MSSFLIHTMKALLMALCFSIIGFGQSPPAGSTRINNIDTVGRVSKMEYDSITTVLVHIGREDQRYRNQLTEVAARFGGDSNEMKALFHQMRQTDSVNLISVDRILTTYGWLGSSLVGSDANSTLFMVIQHADLATQEHYLAMMSEAVKQGTLRASSFALLEDRMALRKGKKQIYGSQVAWNMKTNQYYVMAIEDPDQVDQRRAKVGLVPIAIYILDCCNLVWDLTAYKKDIFSLKAK